MYQSDTRKGSQRT